MPKLRRRRRAPHVAEGHSPPEPQAAALYAGAKQTKYGVEIQRHSQLEAWEKLAKNLGLYAKDNYQRSDPLSLRNMSDAERAMRMQRVLAANPELQATLGCWVRAKPNDGCDLPYLCGAAAPLEAVAALLGQASGFSPSSVRNSFEGKSAIVQHERALQARRSTLVEQFAMAAMSGYQEGRADARAEIAKFNEKNPGRRIQPLQLAQSVRMRTKRIQQAQEAVYLPVKRRDATDAGRFALGQ